MATLLQFERVQTNRSGAVADVTTGLSAGATTQQRIMVAPASVDTAIARVADAVTNLNTAAGTVDVDKLPTTIARTADAVTNLNAASGTVAASKIPLGTGLMVEGGNIVAAPINLATVRTFATTTARNCNHYIYYFMACR